MNQLTIMTSYRESEAQPDVWLLESDNDIDPRAIVTRLRQLHNDFKSYRESDDYNTLDYVDMLVEAITGEYGASITLVSLVHLEITSDDDAIID